MKVKKVDDSLNKRYLFKIVISLLLIPIGIFINIIVPRSLGPILYGKFNYLTISFAQIYQFIELGLGDAFYAKFSQNLKEKSLIRFFYGSRVILSFIILSFFSLILFFDLQLYIWPNQENKYIIMALALSILLFFSSSYRTTVEAFGLTVKGESYNLIIRVLLFFIILWFYFFSEIDLKLFFAYNYLLETALIISCAYILKKNGGSFFDIPKLKTKQILGYIKQFWIYSNPLIGLSIVAALTNFLDIWLLQKFGGDKQQGFYSLAFKISSLAFIFAKPMNSLITREFSIAFGKKDLVEMKNLFMGYVPLLYTLTAFFSVFVSVEAFNLSLLYGGEQFRGTGAVLSVISIYPIHQTYGQLSGSVFLASNQTKLLRNTSIVSRLIGIPITFLLLLPTSYLGLNLGALGLAIKMIIYQFIMINIQLYHNSKYLSLSFKKLISHQIIVVVFFFSCAFLAKYFSNILTTNLFRSLLLSSFIYFVIASALVYNFPIIIFRTKNDIAKLKKKYLKMIYNNVFLS